MSTIASLNRVGAWVSSIESSRLVMRAIEEARETLSRIEGEYAHYQEQLAEIAALQSSIPGISGAVQDLLVNPAIYDSPAALHADLLAGILTPPPEPRAAASPPPAPSVREAELDARVNDLEDEVEALKERLAQQEHFAHVHWAYQWPEDPFDPPGDNYDPRLN